MVLFLRDIGKQEHDGERLRQRSKCVRFLHRDPIREFLYEKHAHHYELRRSSGNLIAVFFGAAVTIKSVKTIDCKELGLEIKLTIML